MLIIAHRGASGEFPENSLLAFEKAIEQKADSIELDIQYHHSGHFILMHDPYLETTTNGIGHFDQQSLSSLRQLSLGQNQTLATLEEALALIAGRVNVNIEIKFPSTKQSVMSAVIKTLHQAMAYAVKCNGFTWQQFTVSSFNHHLLRAIKQQHPLIILGTLIASCPIDYAMCATSLQATSINPSIDCINTELVTDAHQRGLKVLVYTVDRKEDILYCHALGVDGLFTNYPALTRATLEKQEEFNH